MRRVTAIDQEGNISQFENERLVHDAIVYEMFQEFLEPLQDEKLEGDGYIQIWTNAGLVTKYLDMMIYLEIYNDAACTESTICIIPEKINETMINYFEENYLTHEEPFLGLYYSNGKFYTISDNRTRELTAEELCDKLKERFRSKLKK